MKTLLKIDMHDDLGACAAELHVTDEAELFALCSSLISMIVSNKKLSIGFDAILEMAKTMPEFREKLANSSIEVPDFNSILKGN